MIARLSPAERISAAVLGALALAWIIGAGLRRELFFDPVLFGLGSGAIIAALAIGLVVAFRASGVINFGHGAIATYVTYVYVSLVGDGQYPVPPIPNPLAPIEGVARHRDSRLPDLHQPGRLDGQGPRAADRAGHRCGSSGSSPTSQSSAPCDTPRCWPR